MLVLRIWSYSKAKPLVDDFCYSHHLSACHCIDIVKRNSMLITPGSKRVNVNYQVAMTVARQNTNP